MKRLPARPDDLELPVFDQPLPPPPVLSMDQYAAWVESGEGFDAVPGDGDGTRCPLPVPVPFRLLD